MTYPLNKYIWIKHPDSRESKMVLTVEMQLYFAQGWIPGRFETFSEEAKAAAAERCRILGQQNRVKLRLPDEVVFKNPSPHAQVACRRAQERLPNKCCICGQGPIWHGKPLGFHIDHEDGDRLNNTWENQELPVTSILERATETHRTSSPSSKNVRRLRGVAGASGSGIAGGSGVAGTGTIVPFEGTALASRSARTVP